jgi:septum site-determining protein MinC
MVSINLKKDHILLKIDEAGTEEEIIKELSKKITELKNLYKDEKTPIHVTGKILTESEMDSIEKLIKSKINVDVEFDSPRELGLHEIKRTYSQDTGESTTKYIRTSLRSGQRIEYEGSIVIIGDVNDGAEVIAKDNIIVLGILRGLAHAGAKGNKEAFIAAESIEVPQIRIANIVKEVERDEIEDGEIKTFASIGESGETIELGN